MENKLTIRKAEVRDSKAIVKILRSSFQEFKEKYTSQAFESTVISPQEVELRMKNGIVWLAETGEQPLGTVSGKIINNTFYIKGMAVLPYAQGKKVGYLLLQTIEEYAMKNNCNELLLSTTPYLKKAISLYEKFGFKIINEPPYDLFKTPLFNMRKLLR